MTEIPLTQGKVALVDDEDFEFLSQWKWRFHHKCGDRTGYARRFFYQGGKKIGVLMHRELLKPTGEDVVDHINHDGLDNRRSNLRIVLREQNSFNRRKNIKRGSLAVTSSFKGVYWYKARKIWRASIRKNKKLFQLGAFASEIEAALAYNAAALIHHGEYARLNIIPNPNSR